MIKHLEYHQIDIEKYNNCIDKSLNTRVYAYSDYLDVVADNWSVLVLNDYEYVMPLPWRKKYFLKYIYTPCWTQQLGIFSNKEITNELIKLFLNSIPKSFVKTVINFNTLNSKYNFKVKKTNYILPLYPSYKQLFTNYKYVRRRTKKIIDELDVEIVNTEDFKAIIQLFINQKQKEVHLNTTDYDKLEKLILSFQKKERIDIVIARTKNDRHLLGGAIFVKDNKRITYLFSSVTQRGRNEQVMTSIIDSVIKKYANSNLTLDFEGSMIPGIAFFFKSFGAKKETYFNYQKQLSF